MIKILDGAKAHINELKEQHNKKYVRLSVKGGGCAGFGYDWTFEDSPNDTDLIEIGRAHV